MVTIATHRLTPADLETGRLLAAGIDLDPVFMELAEAEVRLTDGGTVRWVQGRIDELEDDLEGPSGWLADFEVGQVIAFVVHDDDRVTLEVSPTLEQFTADEIAAVRRLIEDYDGVADIGELIAEISERGYFSQARPPLSELIVEAGLEYYEGMVGLAGTDWDELDADGDDNDGLLLAAIATGIRDGMAVPQEAAILGAFGEMLAGPDTPEDFVTGCLEEDATESAIALLTAIEAATRGRARAAVLFSLARFAEANGDLAEMERRIDAALAADGHYEPAVEDAVWFASDRGDAARAVSLLKRIGVPPDNEQLLFLSRFAGPMVTAGRNEPCPCGSGGKYKQCCLNASTRPLQQRTVWLWHKAAEFVQRPAHRRLLAELAQRAVGDEVDDFEYPRALLGAISNGPVLDIALFDLGLFDEFVASRGHLLPADERELAETWRKDTRRSVWRVEAVERGSSLTLRDVVAGEQVTVQEQLGSLDARIGDHFWARVTPVGDDYQLMGPVSRLGLGLADRVAGALAEGAGPYDELDLYAELTTPGRRKVTNTEGHDLVFMTARFRLSDASRAIHVLEDAFEAEGGVVWASVALADGSDDVIEISTNSRERVAEAREAVARLLPDATFIDEHVQAFEPAAGGRDHGGDAEPTVQPPELDAALDEYLQEFERKWVDDSIPALGGRTPREAVNDPQLRPRLDALLADMDRMAERQREMRSTGRGMDADRVRRLLGL